MGVFLLAVARFGDMLWRHFTQVSTDASNLTGR